MTEPNRERLYELLPAIHRIRDAAEGQPLRALLGVVEAEARRIESDISGLYENWFIETCEDWVVPYLAELLGIRRLPAVGGPGFNQRTHVANTLSYRRRKGTQSLLADLARDVTGWPVRVVELFRLVGMTNHFEFLQSRRTLDLRNASALARLPTPFDASHRTADVRKISENIAVRQNLPNEAVFVWRLQSYHIEKSPAGIIDANAGQYAFSVLGDDIPLYNRAAADNGVSGLEADLPVALRRAALDEVLEARRQAIAEGRPSPSDPYFDPRPDGRPPVFTILINGQSVLPEQIVIENLGQDWQRPAALKSYRDQFGAEKQLPIVAAVDPRLGRLALLNTDDSSRVSVSYSYGFGGDIGAGPYDISERETFDARFDAVAVNAPGQTISEVLASASPRILEIRDNEIYELSTLTIAAKSTRTIRAGNRLRPVVRIDSNTLLRIELGADASLVLDGLLFTGGDIEVIVAPNSKAKLKLLRCTLRPDEVSFVVTGGALDLTVDHCITSDIDVRPGTVSVFDSIVHGAIDTDTLTMERSTVLRSEFSIEFARAVNVDTLEAASDCIFMRKVFVKFAQRGCMRFSCVGSADSITPTRFRCQPDLATSGSELTPDDIVHILRAIEPRFTSTHFDHPGYGQLVRDNDEQIRRGSSDGGEMGAFQSLHWLQREENLRASLDEYLRFGYDAGIFFMDEAPADVALRVLPAGLPYTVRIVPLAPLTAMTHDIAASTIPLNTLNVNLRDFPALDRLDTPFERLPHTGDPRRIAEEIAVRFDVPNTAIFAWRLESYRIEDAPAGVIDANKGQYTFSILGQDEPLFNPPTINGDAEQDLPVALRRSALDEVVESIRQSLARGQVLAEKPFFDAARPAFQIVVNGSIIPPEQIVIADLTGEFNSPPASKPYVVGGVSISLPIRAAVDPISGRFTLTNPKPTDVVRVSYSYGFSGEVGAGPYARGALVGHSAEAAIEISDNARHGLSSIGLSSDTRLVRAANGKRPAIENPAGGGVITPGKTVLTFDGLLFVRDALEFTVPEDMRATVVLRRCTLPPGQVQLKISGRGALLLILDHCIVGDIVASPETEASIAVQDSIIDGKLQGGVWQIERSTLFGSVDVKAIEFAQDSIFLQKIVVALPNQGEMRFCSLVDDGSITPPRFSCQPDLALGTLGLSSEQKFALRAELRPQFTSERFGDSGYAQLRRDNDDRILHGGENGEELGAFQSLHGASRETATRNKFRKNDNTGFFFVT